jgi:hypothetical protein
MQTLLNFLIFTVIYIVIGVVVFIVGGLCFVSVTNGGGDLGLIFFIVGLVFYALYIAFAWLACFIFCGRTKCTFCGRSCTPENRDPGQAEAQTTESTLPTTPSVIEFPSQSGCVPPPTPTPSPNMSTHAPASVSPTPSPSISTHVPASEPPSVSAYIPTTALAYVIPYTTSQEPSAQATLISPVPAARYATATAVATVLND